MKTNLYYRTLFKRTNVAKEFILNLFLSFASAPRLLLEVFLRKNFGERYFSFAACVAIVFILAVIPFAFFGASRMFVSYRHGMNLSSFLLEYLTWYVFIGLFVFIAVKRRREVKHNPSVFDFERFSLYNGDINPLFFSIRLFGKKADPRSIETLYEPAVCFLVGLGLIILGQTIGTVIIVCSIIYALSYAGAYLKGDHFVMDKIDEMIVNEEMFNAFVEDRDSSKTRGVRFYGRKPVDEEVRRKVVESFTEAGKDEVFEAI